MKATVRFIPNHQILSLHSTAPVPVTNTRRNGDSWVAGGRIYQPIGWDKPKPTGDNEEPDTYVVLLKTTMPGTGTKTNVTRTTKTSLVLSLPLPQQAVIYVVSVAGQAGTERGKYSNNLTLHYSSTSG